MHSRHSGTAAMTNWLTRRSDQPSYMQLLLADFLAEPPVALLVVRCPGHLHLKKAINSPEAWKIHGYD